MEFKERVKLFRKKAGLTQPILAKKMAVHPRTVSHWEQGRQQPAPNQRAALCKILNISEAELFGADPVANISAKKVPILGWAHAQNFKDMPEPVYPEIANDWTYVVTKCLRPFGLRVENDCMEEKFHAGDIIILCPDSIVKHKDFVVVADREKNTATFKQYLRYGDKIILHPLNEKYPDIELDNSDRYHIIGKVIKRQEDFT